MAYNSEYYKKNKDKFLARQREYRANNPDVKREQKRRYKLRHPDKIAEEAKRYQANYKIRHGVSAGRAAQLRLKESNPELYTQKRREAKRLYAARRRWLKLLAAMIWAWENPVEYQELVAASLPKPKPIKPVPTPEELEAKAVARRAKERASEKRYAAKNPEKAREKRRRRKKRKLARDPSYRLAHKIRTRLHGSLRGGRKSASTLKLVGLGSWDEVRRHLESTWTKGMSWDTYGLRGWHIDHIRPICSFDMTKPEDQAACWNYKNLQALWWHENVIEKGGRLDYYDKT